MTVLEKQGDWMILPTRRGVYRQFFQPKYASFEDEFWKEYYASSVRDGVDRLLRKGQVEKIETADGTKVRLTYKGKTEVIKYNLETMEISKPERWDGKWRMVFFDVEEKDRMRRDKLRKWLTKLGLRRMQKSVFVYPYPLEREIKFLREVLDVPDLVKLVTADSIENDEDLREWFDL